MKYLQLFFVALVAAEHIYFMILEVFYWDKPRGLKAFGNTIEEAKTTKILAKNQGLYNGFLAAGLIWSLINSDNSLEIALFFLICVAIAGIYGAYTTKKLKILYVQFIPAFIGIILTLLLN